MSSFDVCVRGNGAVGMSLALALGRLGLRVALAGRTAATGRADVRAYALNAGSVGLLKRLKVWEALPVEARTPVHDMRVHGDAGAVLRFSSHAQAVEALAWIVDAAQLEDELRQALRYAPHVQAVGEEGAPAALQALAEGKSSATREALGVPLNLQPYGHSAVAARLVADAPHLGVAWQWFQSPDILALLPFDRPVAGRGYALVWSVPQARAQALLALDEEAFHQALNDATGGAAGTLHLASERAAWPLALGRAERLCGPGWVLLGDAAHVVHPLAGQGLNLGLADVAALARVLEAREPWRPLGDERLLRRYQRERHLPTVAMAGVTDGLWQLFSHSHPALRELRNRGMDLVEHLSPLKRLLAERALNS